jgi:hypothetical protein
MMANVDASSNEIKLGNENRFPLWVVLLKKLLFVSASLDRDLMKEIMATASDDLNPVAPQQSKIPWNMRDIKMSKQWHDIILKHPFAIDSYKY